MQAHLILQYTLLFLTLSGYHALISASPFGPRQQTYNCTDLHAVYDSRCWAELGMVDFLNDPKTGWNTSTKTCDTSADGVNCCLLNKAWSTCFMRLAFGSPGYDCSRINSQACNFQVPPAGQVDPALQPKYQYALKAIFAINDLFTTWYTASETALNQAPFIVQPIITEIDTQQKTTLSIYALVSATIAGLPYLASPYMANVIGLSLATQQTSQALQSSFQTAPAVSKALWPLSVINTRQISISALNSTLPTLTNELAAYLNDGLNLIMSDMPTFIAFASSGAYTDSTSLSLPSQVPGITYALSTYIISSALSANGYIAQTTTNASQAAAHAECLRHDHMDPTLCAVQQQSTWNDNSTGLIFNIGSDGTTQNPISKTAFAAVFDSNRTMEEALFAGPYVCAEGERFDAGNVVNSNATGGLDLSCMSRLRGCKASGDAGVGGNIETCPAAWALLSG